MEYIVKIKKEKFPRMKDNDRFLFKVSTIEEFKTKVVQDELLRLGLQQDDVEVVKDIENHVVELQKAVQDKIDSLAKQYGYDDMQSARAWRNTEGYSQNELVEKLTIWAGSCWDFTRNFKEDIGSGVRSMPTVEELIEQLPPFLN